MQKHVVSVEEIQHMAALSRLVITQDEEKLFSRQFTQILDHMDILGKVDTSHVEPLYSCMTEDLETRQDEACNRRTLEEILSNAPETDGESFIVPRIV